MSQIAVNVIDFQFKQMVEVIALSTHERTRIIGQVYASIDAGTIVLNLLTGVILARLGMRFSLLSIPAIFAAAGAAFALVPQFLTIAISKVSSKITTYSLFKAAKEILYIPLDYQEKTQGKAIVDVLMYRGAKGIASILLWLILALNLKSWLHGLLFLSLGIWIWLTFKILERYRQRLSESDDASAF
jgi:ATP/ADP translocase